MKRLSGRPAPVASSLAQTAAASNCPGISQDAPDHRAQPTTCSPRHRTAQHRTAQHCLRLDTAGRQGGGAREPRSGHARRGAARAHVPRAVAAAAHIDHAMRVVQRQHVHDAVRWLPLPRLHEARDLRLEPSMCRDHPLGPARRTCQGGPAAHSRARALGKGQQNSPTPSAAKKGAAGRKQRPKLRGGPETLTVNRPEV